MLLILRIPLSSSEYGLRVKRALTPLTNSSPKKYFLRLVSKPIRPFLSKSEKALGSGESTCLPTTVITPARISSVTKIAKWGRQKRRR